MRKRTKEWYRDEIDMLKGNQEHMRWKIMGIITICLALASLCYLVWYEEESCIVRVLIVIIFIGILVWTNKNLKECITEGKRLSKKIGKNYEVLLK